MIEIIIREIFMGRGGERKPEYIVAHGDGLVAPTKVRILGRALENLLHDPMFDGDVRVDRLKAALKAFFESEE